MNPTSEVPSSSTRKKSHSLEMESQLQDKELDMCVLAFDRNISSASVSSTVPYLF